VLELSHTCSLFRGSTTLYPHGAGLIWLYILVAGAPPSAIRAGVVASFVLATGLLGRQVSPV
jgi:predicted membrane metal-binding protein